MRNKLLISISSLASCLAACSAGERNTSPGDGAGAPGTAGDSGITVPTGSPAGAGGMMMGLPSGNAGNAAGGQGGMGDVPGGSGAPPSLGGASGGGTPAMPGSDACSGPGIVLCDDFETGSVGQQPDPSKWWQRDPFQPGNPATIVSGGVLGSAQAFSVTSTNSEVMLVNSQTLQQLGIADNDFYVRVWLRPSVSTSTVMGHSDFIEAAEPNTQGNFPQFGDGGEELRFGVSQNLLDLNIQPGTECGGEKTRRTNGLVDMSGGTGFNFEADIWHCVELHFAGATDNLIDTFELWVDGVAIDTLTAAGFPDQNGGNQCSLDWMPDFAYLKVGAQDFSATLGEVSYDDLAIGTERIGCNGP